VKAGDFPTRDNCNPEDPSEAFLWMLVALPYQNGGQLVMPVEYLKLVSKRLWDLGARPVAEPEIAYVAPSSSSPHWLTDPGKFVPVDQVEEARQEAEIDGALAKMGHRQSVELFQALEADEAGRDIPDTPAGQVVRGMPPKEKAAVLKRLRDTT